MSPTGSSAGAAARSAKCGNTSGPIWSVMTRRGVGRLARRPVARCQLTGLPPSAPAHATATTTCQGPDLVHNRRQFDLELAPHAPQVIHKVPAASQSTTGPAGPSRWHGSRARQANNCNVCAATAGAVGARSYLRMARKSGFRECRTNRPVSSRRIAMYSSVGIEEDSIMNSSTRAGTVKGG